MHCWGITAIFFYIVFYSQRFKISWTNCFCYWLKIVGSQWLQMLFPPLRCSALPLLHPPSVGSCLWVPLPFGFAFSRLRSGDWLGHWWILHFFALRHSRIAFAVCFGTVKCRWVSFSASGWIWAESKVPCTSEIILLLLSVVTSSLNTCSPVPPAAVHFQYHRLADDMGRFLELLLSFSILFSSQVYLGFSFPKTL